MSSTWTQIEKQQLLEALRKYGINDLEKLANDIPYKSVCDIRTIISKYESLAIRSLTESSSTASASGDASVDKWIDIMKQILTKNNHNIISRALKYIALFEAKTQNNINLDDCYKVLSDLTNGQPSKQLNYETAVFFNGCLSNLAKSVSENKYEREETYLDSLEFNKLSATKTYRSKVDKNPVISDVNMNPCKVPLNLLTEHND